ncbi:MAG TPA: methionine synthase [Planctomycetota bacterium]|nr:methionine synthase [Planctomycetota bacterium]
MIRDLLRERVLVLDGAMGTEIQARQLTADDFGGAAYEGCNEHLNLTRPDVIASIHRGYLEAGADIIETNTFGSTPLVLAEYDLATRAREITVAGARLARELADAHATAAKPRFVAGSMGPTTKAISVTGGVTFEELVRTFAAQAEALVEGGVDYLLIETAQDTRNIKAALLGAREGSARGGRDVPVAVSGTIEATGTMLAGQTADALAVSLAHADLLYLGLNCATGPDFMTDHLRAISELCRTFTACVPNAGLPDENGCYLETPGTIARVLERFVDEGWVNVVGGCCGTTAKHIAALARMVEGKRPRTPASFRRTLVSGLETVEAEDSNRPLLVGERTNVLGSRKFKRLVAEGAFEEAAEIARKQVKGGAQVIDVCLQDPDRDEKADMRAFLARVTRMVKAPLMIDSTDADVIAESLTWCQGKAIINSVNLEDGIERFERVVPLARRFGAALVVGCIDEKGMAVTRRRKLEVAERSHRILTGDFGVDPSDILFDALVFPCGTGDQTYLGSARETVEGIRLIKERLGAKTILGVSNVSFGLPAAGREVVNTVFLHDCTKAGLDLAIVNAEKLERYASLDGAERRLAEEVLYETSDASLARFTEHFRAARAPGPPVASLTPDETLARCIVDGTKEGLVPALDRKLAEGMKPLDIINGPLMKGMDEVGRLFNDNQLIVAEVLQSAEAMKAAVSHLEPHMEKEEGGVRGTVILATVKGDVHDIGKNLVDIILSNNGFKVVNLGIKVPPFDLVEAIARHQPDIVGLSGLLVKSAQQMVVTAEELSVHGKCPPLLVGGAALTRAFTRRRIAPKYKGMTLYAKDAMDGLELANRLRDPQARPALERLVRDEEAKYPAEEERVPAPVRGVPSPVARVAPPEPPDFERHVMKLPLEEVWRFINPQMLYGRHLGLKGRFEELLERGDEKARMLRDVVEAAKADARGWMAARAVWRFFAAHGDGETVRVAGEALTFPRQKGGERLCLADFVGEKDVLCLFAVTAGAGVRERAEAWKAKGEFVRSHAVQALAIETAEAAAEWLHSKLRGLWGFPDAPEMAMLDRFRAKYRGKRYSFGYPACPDLAMQEVLWRLIDPLEIGIALTDGHMMDPEASVSALVLHHPEARYFAS